MRQRSRFAALGGWRVETWLQRMGASLLGDRDDEIIAFGTHLNTTEIGDRCFGTR